MDGGTVSLTIAVATVIFMAGLNVATIRFLVSDLRAIKLQISELNFVVTKQAVSEERQNNFDTRVNLIAQRVDELAHGHGFVAKPGEYL